MKARERGVRGKGRVSVLAVVVAGMIALGALAFTSAAVAQEYGESRGSLPVRHYLEVSGDGFSANSAVKMALVSKDTGETIDLGTLVADTSGILAGSVTLPDGLDLGAYTLSATGVTADGAARVLATELVVPAIGAGEAPCETAGGLPVWLIAGLPVLAPAVAGGGWWLLRVRRRGWAR